jgi:LPS export ABC transporter protein LptC
MSRRPARPRFIVSLAIVLAGICLYLLESEQNNTAEYVGSDVLKPSHFISNARFVYYNKEGEIKLDVEAMRAKYYEAPEEVIEIEAPTIHYLPSQNLKMDLRAKFGRYLPATESLILKDAVELSREDKTFGEVQILTETLYLDAEKRFISTDQLVTIKQNKSQLTSYGLEASLNDKKLQLVDRVRGYYETTP